jgi:hypothetical protein
MLIITEDLIRRSVIDDRISLQRRRISASSSSKMAFRE